MPKVFYHKGGGLQPIPFYERGWYYEVDDVVWGTKSSINNRGAYRTERLAQIGLRNHLQRLYWSDIWYSALRNMPYRIELTGPYEEWVPLPKGETPIPEAIRGLAKGYYQHDSDGKLCLVRKAYDKRRVGHQNCLTRLLKYKSVAGLYEKKDGYSCPIRVGKRQVIAHNTVYNNARRGSKPKDKWRQDLLVRLAQDDGRQVAAELLKQQGFNLDKYNYVY